MGRVHIFAQYGDDPARQWLPAVVDSTEMEPTVAALEAEGAQVVVLDGDERVIYGLLTKDLIAAHSGLLPGWSRLLTDPGRTPRSVS